jgi:hypothetical protein
MMQPIRRALRGFAAVMASAALGACENEIPTATGPDLFPGGVSPTTLVAEFTGTDLILRQEAHAGFGDPRLTPFLIVADRFEEDLSANAIARFRGFPDSISYVSSGATVRDEVGSFVGGRVLVEVDRRASQPVETSRLFLRELTQPWDSASVTWTHAVDRPGEQVPWAQPGAANGPFLAENFWFPSDTATHDTVVWHLDSLTVDRLRQEDHPGVLVTLDRLGARLKLSGLTVALDVRPAGNPDTVVEFRTMEGAQTFIYTPAEPEDAAVLNSGGLRGNRSILTLDLEQEVEACPAGGGACTLLPLSEVTLNRAQLVFDPVPVPGGHRPLVAPRVQLRRIAEPELGRFAPLGTVVASDTISGSAFTEGSDREFALDMTNAVLQYIAEGEDEVSLGVLTAFEVPDLGLVWFERSPRLRVIYTLPLNPVLP